MEEVKVSHLNLLKKHNKNNKKPPKKEIISITILPELLEKVDTARKNPTGDTPRSTFICNILEGYFK